MAGTVLAGGLETGLSGAPLAAGAAAVTQRHRRALLAATALAGGVAAGMFGAPQGALAGCTVSGSTTVTCGNTATTDTTFSTNQPNDRGYSFGTPLTGTVNGAITGFGLGFQTTGANTISVTNTGSINQTLLPGGAHQGTAALAIIGSGAATTYTGPGTITSSVAAGLNMSNTGAGTIAATANGQVSGITVGVDASTNGTGAVTVGGTGDISGLTTAGIRAQETGVGPGAGLTGVTVTGSGNTSSGMGEGIIAAITNSSNASNILVNRSGKVDAQTIGIDASSLGTGSITVTGVGVVTSAGGFGITAVQKGTGASNTGSVSVSSSDVTAAGTGINAQITGTSTGNVTVSGTGNVLAGLIGINATTVNGGDVTVQNTGNVTGANVVGINATSGTGNVRVGGGASLAISAVKGATGINASTGGSGTVTVTTSNNVTATAGNGIQTSAVNGLNTVNVTGGTIQATGNGIAATSTGTGGVTVTMSDGAQVGTSTATRVGGAGIVATSSGTGDVNVTSTRIFSTGAGITASISGASAITGNIVVQSNGAINTSGGDGIDASITNMNSSGNITVTTGSSGTITATPGHSGINALQGGTGAVTITVGAAISQPDFGVNAVITNGTNTHDLTVHANGTVNANVFGINAVVDGHGNVVVDGSGNVTGGVVGVRTVQAGGSGGITVSGSGATTGQTAIGIDAAILSLTNNSNILISRSGGVTGGSDGIDATTAGGGTVTVTSGGVTGQTGNGIFASSAGGSVFVTPGGTVNGGTNGIVAVAPSAVTVTTFGGGAGNVTGSNGAGVIAMGVNGPVTVTASAGDIISGGTIGVFAQTAGIGAVTVTGAGNISGTSVAGIVAQETGAGPGAGKAGITVSGIGTTSSTSGAGIIALIANASNASDILVNRSGAVTAGTVGIAAASAGTGNVTVTGVGPITAGGTGIIAQNTNATTSGNVVVTTSNTVIGAAGINASVAAGSGTVTVTAGNNVIGAAGIGIKTASAAGATTINVNAGTTAGSTDAISATSTGGAIQINNSAVVENLSGLFGSAAVATSGAGNATFNNNGIVSGTLAMTGTGTNTFDNAGLWNTLGTSTFGGGASSLNNSGIINVPGSATFTNLTNFNNGGLIDLTGGSTPTANKLTTTGSFNGQSGSAVNVLFDAHTANSATAGQVIANGTSGTVRINFADVTAGTQVVLGSAINVIKDNTLGGSLQVTGGCEAFGLINMCAQSDHHGGAELARSLNLGAAAAPGASVMAALSAIDSSFHQSTAPFVASPQSQDPDKWTGGVWSRATTGQTTTKLTSFESFGGTSAPLRVKTNFDAYEVGVDTGMLNFGGGGWNGHFGIMAGAVMATANETLSGSGTSVKFDVPFAGIYGVVTHGPFFMDLEARHDWVDTKVTNVTANLNNTPLKGHGDSVSGSAGYHFDLVNNWFIEPAAGFGLTQTQFDTLATNVNDPHAGVAAGTISFDSLFSMLVHGGARVGTSFVVADTLALQPFGTLSAWRELGGQSNATFANGGATDPLSLSRVGTFYQAGLGLSGQLLNTGLIGFVRGDIRWGDNLNGTSVVGGLRYSFGP